VLLSLCVPTSLSREKSVLVLAKCCLFMQNTQVGRENWWMIDVHQTGTAAFIVSDDCLQQIHGRTQEKFPIYLAPGCDKVSGKRGTKRWSVPA
jgi:hypothetical protein